jgi:hypothetical protein
MRLAVAVVQQPGAGVATQPVQAGQPGYDDDQQQRVDRTAAHQQGSRHHNNSRDCGDPREWGLEIPHDVLSLRSEPR